jgi:hypothetical protein
MRNQPIDLGTLVIANAGSNSTALEFKRKPVRGIVIYAPAALTGTVTVQVAIGATEAAATWVDLQSAGSDVEVAAGKAVTIDAIAWDWLRVQSDGAEGSERTFTVMAYEDVT